MRRTPRKVTRNLLVVQKVKETKFTIFVFADHEDIQQIQFKLNDLDDYTALQNLFEEYRFKSVTYKMLPCFQTPGLINGSGSNNFHMPSVYIAQPLVGGAASVADMKETNCRVCNATGTNIVWKGKPKIKKFIFGDTSTYQIANPEWVNTYYYSLVHYGPTVAIGQAWDNGLGYYTRSHMIEVTYEIEFRKPK